MTPTSKKFAILSLVFLVVGFADVHSAILWGIMKPLGATFLVLFLITYLMAGEMELYEEQCRSKSKSEGKRKSSKKPA